MGKKQKENRNAAKLGSQQNQKLGGIAGRQNVLAAKNELTAADTLRKGRHECQCQARIHELVLNCLGCGRIVCAQEGSGPCFTCNTLVCTREERAIINSGTKKGEELKKKLYSNTNFVNVEKIEGGRSFEAATQFRDRLLEADADTERRTRVNDLQSDYTNIESSSFLNCEERERLKQRRDELKALLEKERRKFVVAIDLEGGVVQSSNKSELSENDFGNDPIIHEILESADDRRRAQEVAYNNACDAHWSPIGFVPKYLNEAGQKIDTKQCSDGDIIDAESLMIVSDELSAQITEEKGLTISVPQPAAAFLVHGLLRFYCWKEDLMLKGPLFITSKATETNEKDIIEFSKKFVRDVSKVNNLDFSSGAVLGRAFLDECLLLEDFYDKYGSNSKVPGEGNFVLCFNAFEPLVSSVPHIPEGDFYEMDRQLKKTLTKR
ncbi:unnamed protein product [Caenorhabditis bovis]|uniref:Zinc finger C2HC5-type domain-containing protein n=1 Tax=Caenorhabditis bovis TaxID=2654633 RepID=A0A8S1F0E7_9PELO|nr:unnamed protein product [Caenorhabditis bovis]